MAFAYPVFLEVQGKRAVVIGSLAVEEGKSEALRSAGAEVDVFANSSWTPEDLDGAAICVASSSDADERDAIARAARDRGVLVNVMDDISNCDFAAPAIVRRGDLVLAISTGGTSPTVARKVREDLERRFGSEWAETLAVIAEVRRETLPALGDLRVRAKRWRQALDLDEAVELVRTGRADELRRTLIERLLGEGAA
jgi:precorrin-2 dehydrogenase/sirohydrochlorin ferrochelatase